MNHKLRFLILAYYFPPDNNISSRRWAKFSKYLVKSGQDVTVLASKTQPDQKSPWDDDIQDLKVVRYDRNYPQILEIIPKSYREKVQYRLAINNLQKQITGTIYDRCVFVEDDFIDAASDIIVKKNIDVIISNGPPHRIMYFGALLKKKFPHLFLISDFRDPWTWWYNYGYPSLVGKDKKEEERMESIVMKYSDLVTVPVEEMETYLTQRYNSDKVELLPHGIDPDDFGERRTEYNKDIQKTRFVYFGNIYSGEDKVFAVIADALTKNKNATLDFYTDQKNYELIFQENCEAGQVRYHKSVSSKKLFRKLPEYDAVLMVMPKKFKNIFSSKFYEILYAGLPIVLISEKGSLSEFIIKHNLGLWLNGEIYKSLSSLFSGKVKIEAPEYYDLENYKFESLVSLFVNKIKREFIED